MRFPEAIRSQVARARSVLRERVIWPLRQLLLRAVFRLRLGRHIPPTTLRIVCFTQVKDEVDLIRDWLNYHLHLFGDGNVVVLDDASSDGTEVVLREYATDGRVDLRRLPPDQQGLWRKLDNLSRAMSTYRDNSDILVPIDCDEFVCVGGSVDKRSILSEFRALDTRAWGIFKFRSEYESSTWAETHGRPATEIRRFGVRSPGRDMKKVFFAARSFERVGEGQHTGYVTRQHDVPYVTDLDLFHFKWRGLQQMRLKCRKGAEGFNFWQGTRPAGSHYKAGLEEIALGFERRFFEREIPPAEVASGALAELLWQLEDLGQADRTRR